MQDVKKSWQGVKKIMRIDDIFPIGYRNSEANCLQMTFVKYKNNDQNIFFRHLYKILYGWVGRASGIHRCDHEFESLSFSSGSGRHKRCGNRIDLAPIHSLSIIIVTIREKVDGVWCYAPFPFHKKIFSIIIYKRWKRISGGIFGFLGSTYFI